MKKIIILIPVFNDWESLIKLINEINENINNFKDIDFECIVINDASTKSCPSLSKPNNIKSLHLGNQFFSSYQILIFLDKLLEIK